MNFPFLDTNVLLRHLLDNDPDLSPRASAFLERVEAGEIRVEISETVVAEIVFTLERSYKFPKTAIHDALVKIIDIPGMHLPRSRIVREALDAYVRYNVSYADAYHAMLMRERGISEVVSFDFHFDRFPGLTRIIP